MDRVAALAQVRAVGILLAGIVVLVGSTPMPGPASRDMLQTADVIEETRAWAALLGAVGVEIAPETLGDIAYRIGTLARAGRQGVLDPLAVPIKLTGTAQGWGLFAYPKTHPHSLRVEVRRGDGPWVAVYDTVEPDLRWSAAWLHYRRVRALYTPGRRAPRTYDAFVDALARRAMLADPTVTELRVRQRRWVVRPPPGPVREPEGWRLRRTRARHSLLPEPGP